MWLPRQLRGVQSGFKQAICTNGLAAAEIFALLQRRDGHQVLCQCPGAWSEDERQLRAAFATVLQENAQLHKAVNAALRSGGISTAAAAAAVRAVVPLCSVPAVQG
jgi:hypothetical protein